MQFFDSEIIFADAEHAKILVAKSDTYSNLLTPFDLQAKVQRVCKLKESDYLSNAQKYLYDWYVYEKDYLEWIIQETAKKINKQQFKFNLPKKIVIIKSAMHEEGGANGFTRQNFMVLNRHSLSEHLFQHELFHIISRYNLKKVESAYKILGFYKCNEVQIPATLIEYKITNPDAPFNNFYMKLKWKNQPVEALMILYSKKNYSGGKFFSYLNKGLMLVEGADNDKKAVISKGAPIILSYDEVTNLYEQIGRNTSYNIHQEEITADHFIMALNSETNLPDQELVDKLSQVLNQ